MNGSAYQGFLLAAFGAWHPAPGINADDQSGIEWRYEPGSVVRIRGLYVANSAHSSYGFSSLLLWGTPEGSSGSIMGGGQMNFAVWDIKNNSVAYANVMTDTVKLYNNAGSFTSPPQFYLDVTFTVRVGSGS